MSDFEEIKIAITKAIYEGDEASSAALTRKAMDAGVTPDRIFQECVVPSLKDVGEKFGRMEIFLPEMMMSADAAKAIFEVLDPVIQAQKSGVRTLGKVVIGTVAGDVHDIGKNMVASMLEVNGFEVFNLGCDVPVKSFLETARQKEANIIAMSSLLTTSLPYMKDLLSIVQEAGERERFKVMVGGGPVTADWAGKVGADGYGKDAAEAVEIARKLVGA